jgi:hypothetical protein
MAILPTLSSSPKYACHRHRQHFRPKCTLHASVRDFFSSVLLSSFRSATVALSFSRKQNIKTRVQIRRSFSLQKTSESSESFVGIFFSQKN